jgi:hypothetical protein
MATAKDNKEAQINELKIRVKQNKIFIHPRCENLLYHLKSAKWKLKRDGTRDGFERLKDVKEKNLRGGHADLLDALIYLVRNVSTLKNPYPIDYFELKGENVFNQGIRKADETMLNIFKSIMNIKKK